MKEKEAFVEDVLHAVLHNSGVVEVTWDTSIEEINVDHLKKMQDVVAELGEGKKMPIYFSTHDFLGISSEARKYASSREGTQYTLATAVLVNNLAMQMLMNFFMRVNKPIIPTKGFTTKQDCISWLEKVYL